uniref:RING-type E3 ubiquitin transferase n=1 Tax=Tetranychus urticae TaxID=32264 RepID=T1KDI4_TETUR
MSTTQINGVTFCRNFVNRGYCYGLGCKYLHVDRQIESHYKRTGRLPTELANEWCNTQKILAKRDPNVCQDQNQSKCFRVNCKFGTHHVFRTDMDAGNIVEFTFRPSPKMMDYLAHIYQAPKPYWYSDVLCHIRTPFPLLAEHIIKKTFRIQRSQVSFYYNEREIMPNDSNVTPYSLDIGNGVIVDISFDGSLAEMDCSICLNVASERCYCFPCNHFFCIDCSLSWFFGLSNSNLKLCPLCRADVNQLHFRVEGQITVADYRNLAQMSDNELSDWTNHYLARPFFRLEEPSNIVNYLPADFGDKEKELLVSLIEDHPKKELTTNRNNDKDTSIAKKNFWCEIAEIEDLFKNMVTRAKNAQAENKKETIKTGGGQKESEIGSINSKVINVIGDTIKPYDNQFDSDANVN